MSACSVTHQHPPQTAKIVSLTPPVGDLLEADSMAQPYELLTNIHGLGETTVLHRVCKKTADGMRNKSNRYLENIKTAYLAITGVTEPDTGPGGDLRVRVAAQFGLQRSPGGTVCEPLKLIQRCLSPHLSWKTGGEQIRKNDNNLWGGGVFSWGSRINTTSVDFHLFLSLCDKVMKTRALPFGLTPAKLHSIAWNGKLRKSLLKC